MKITATLLATVAFALAGTLTAAEPAAGTPVTAPSGPLPIEQFVGADLFEQLKISPTGEYLAATVPLEDRTALVVMRRKDMQRMTVVNVQPRTRVENFWWVNDRRVLLTLSEQHGAYAQRYGTGEIWGTDVDGANQGLLVGLRRAGSTHTESRIKSRHQELIYAQMVDTLHDDDDHVLVSITPLNAGEDPFTSLERMHVTRGSRQKIARAPVRNARFLVDHAKVARFALGQGADNHSKLYYRSGRDVEWELVNDHAVSDVNVYPLAFRGDDRVAYLEVEQPGKPNAVHAFDVASKRHALLVQDPKVDPAGLLFGADDTTPYAIDYLDGIPRQHDLDAAVPEARLLRSLQKSFPGHGVRITGFTRDGNLALVYVYSAGNPGDFYVFDRARKEAHHLASRRQQIDPERMAGMRSVSIRARDGRMLHGFLTVPPGVGEKSLPVIVNPHGGPFDVFDRWEFLPETQLFASRGYAVLQLNFRGSGNYGRDHVRAGYRQWGAAMQDDLTDATRWLIDEGIADKSRICIYGASYGAYAALMGVAREPGLYACAVGYVGAYDLPLMHDDGDIRDRKWGANYLSDTLGADRRRLGEVSPTRLAERIDVPVFLAAGGIDERTPIKHSERMRDALTAAGNPPEWLVFPDEGHGFEQEANVRTYYTRLLAFLDKHIGAPRR